MLLNAPRSCRDASLRALQQYTYAHLRSARRTASRTKVPGHVSGGIDLRCLRLDPSRFQRHVSECPKKGCTFRGPKARRCLSSLGDQNENHQTSASSEILVFSALGTESIDSFVVRFRFLPECPCKRMAMSDCVQTSVCVCLPDVESTTGVCAPSASVSGSLSKGLHLFSFQSNLRRSSLQ
jgi:hypothetical protein